MTLKLRVGRKGYIILPKAVREAVGLDEGDEVIVEIGDGIILKPARGNVDVEEVRRLLAAHAEKLRGLRVKGKPKPGEPASAYLEEEFGD